MTKNEMRKLLNDLEKHEYYENDVTFIILKKYLLENRREDDEDMEVLTPQLLTQIIDLFMGCYNVEDLMKWLTKNNYDPINDFRFSERYSYNDLDDEELKRLKDDCLFNDEENEILVISW